MFFSGIADEAGKSIDVQIMAHQQLAWDYMELRSVDGTNATGLSDACFDSVVDALAEAAIDVSCFASAIANWARPVTSDFQLDVDDLERAIPRMHRLGTPFIRVMSYPNDPDHPLPDAAWRNEAIKRMKALAAIAEDGGVTLAHENCSGWGGLSAENSNILLGEVASPALKVVFDTGNPVTYGQDAWDYYQQVAGDIVYVHIKDAKTVDGEHVYTYCGDGDGYVREIVGDLLGKGYDGGFSIEPHLAAVIHTGQEAETAAALYESYVEYGRRFMRLVDEAAPE
ncbi:MAG TPA: sugar phosphate isomerase/epimerase [Candidatus Hydrogenedentes bacterium]|nr:sugar phosphate isomerase/epimerase [Candidatus Hydrogenedentota bacterium]